MNKVPDLVDNDEVSLKSVLTTLLRGEQVSLSIVTAYFNLKAMEELNEVIENLTSLRLLLGTEQDQQFVADKRLFFELDEAQSLGEAGVEAAIKRWEAFLKQDKVQVRLFRKGFLHGKAYLVEGVPLLGTVGIVGSSNFTGAGLATNRELNAVLKQESAVQKLKEWWEACFTEAEDYKSSLLETLLPFTTDYSPYEIYIKVLYEAYKDRFAADGKPGVKPSPIFLTDFQRVGYMAAKDIIEHYRGVLIADSVGLGKTYIALRLLDDYAYHARETALVICPAQLRDTLWQPLLQSHAIPHRIESMEFLSQSDAPISEMAQYKVIVVDESHNFRNSATNRWENLFHILSHGDGDKKLILLTATPVNNSVFDFYHQVRLITRDAQGLFADAGIPNLLGYFRRAEENKEALYELLEAIAVRRSRQFIRRNYPHATIDGQPVRFPDRKLHRIDYSLQKSYSGLYDEVASAIANLFLAPYEVDTYRKEVTGLRLSLLFDEKGQQESLHGWLITSLHWDKRSAQDFLMRLGRQTALAHIMRVLYLKRLESSVQALRISLNRQLGFQKAFLKALNAARLLDVHSYRRWLAQEGSDELLEEEVNLDALIASLPMLDANAYDLDALSIAVQADVQTLNELCGKLDQLTSAEDDKLRQLKHLLSSQLKGKKVVVFTYFRDTARYLHRHLGGNKEWLDQQATPREKQQIEEFLRQFGHQQISVVDSGVKPDERRDRVFRFAPRTHKHNEIVGTERELDLLISTDVLSEGQNLQDAEVVINYDLHWNPVRMVQRVGRIDRIGSPHETLHLCNFFPEDALESLLGLMERLWQKLSAINRTVGLDASVLGETPNPMDFNALERIRKNDASVLDELSSDNELNIGEFLLQDLLDFLQMAGEERIQQIPLGKGIGKDGKGRRGVFAAFHHPHTGRHHFLFYDLRASEGSPFVEGIEAIRLARSLPDEPSVPVPVSLNAYDIITTLRRHLLTRLNQVVHRLPHLLSPQNHVVNWLQSMPPSQKRNALLGYFSRPLSNLALKDLRQLWRANRSLPADKLLALFTQFAGTHPQPSVPTPPASDQGEKDLELVGWIALV